MMGDILPDEPGLGLLWLPLLLDNCEEFDGLTGLELSVVLFWGKNFMGFINGRMGEGCNRGHMYRTVMYMYKNVMMEGCNSIGYLIYIVTNLTL